MTIQTTRTWLAAGLLALAEPVVAAPQPDDFAFGIPIETEGTHALWRVSLPDEVYRAATRSDLGDLRVFDRSGHPVPHSLQRPAALDAPVPPAISLPYFPLQSPLGLADGSHSVRITTNDQGAVIDVTGDTTTGLADDGRIDGYLIDASALEAIPDGLSLQWTTTNDRGFTARVRLEASDDLAHWRNLVSRATLADLKFGDARLRSDKLELPQQKARYLRMSWPDRLREVRLTRVEATFPREQRPPPRHWLTLDQPQTIEEPFGLQFESGGYWPIDRVRLAFPSRNALLRAKIESTGDPNTHWRSRFRGLFYRLEQNDATLLSDPLALPPTSDRHWRLLPATADSWNEGGQPALELGWVPHELTFVDQGEAPYTLAFGSAEIEPAQEPVAGLLTLVDADQQESLIGKARLGRSGTLGGEARLQPAPSPLPWKKWLLWAVLVLGVLLLAWMVRKLMGQMEARD